MAVVAERGTALDEEIYHVIIEREKAYARAPWIRLPRGQTEFQVNLKLGLTPCLPQLPVLSGFSRFGGYHLSSPRTPGPPRHFFLSFLGFSIVTNYRTYTLYLLSTTKATTNLVKRCDDVPQRFSFPPNAELAIRPSPPILMRWPCPAPRPGGM